MTNKLREVAQQALEALESCRIRSVSEWEVRDVTPKNVTTAITALRAALADAYENEAWNAYDRAMEEPVANIGCLGMPVNTPVTAPQPAKPTEQEPADGCVVVARPILRTLGIDDAVIDTIARPQLAKRVPLTRDQLADAWIETAHITHATDRQIAFASAVIAAYERKNGITGGTK